jgi:hypothetical protein
LPALPFQGLLPDPSLLCFATTIFRDEKGASNCRGALRRAGASPHHALAFGETTMNQPSDRRLEPEIIPPGAPLPRGAGVWIASDPHRTHYVYTSTRMGPISIAFLTLVAGGVLTLAVLFLLSAALIGFAAIGVITVAAVIAGILRKPT